jgi:nucleotide-binding universal stress UspA family protein
MYKHILLPTDGSELSRQAAISGIRFAKDIGASVIAIHAIPVPHIDRLEAWMHHDDPKYAERIKALFDKFADEYLSFIADHAHSENVRCECRKMSQSEPYLAILNTVEQAHCDLIYMASHGWKGDQAQLLGSETLKVLRQSKVPVLVFKPTGAHA